MHLLLQLIFWLLAVIFVFLIAFLITNWRRHVTTRRSTGRQWRDGSIGVLIIVLVIVPALLLINFGGHRGEIAFYAISVVVLIALSCWGLHGAVRRSLGWTPGNRWWPRTAIGGLLYGLGCLSMALNFLAEIENWNGLPSAALGMVDIVGILAGLWVEMRARQLAEGS